MRERLAALPSLPSLDLVASISGALAGQRAPTAGDARVQATFLQLALDFRFIHKAGPHVIRSAEAVFWKERGDRRDFIGRVLAESGATGPDELMPPHPQYRGMVEVLAEYRALVAKGGCDKLASGWCFRTGAKCGEGRTFQRRLA